MRLRTALGAAGGAAASLLLLAACTQPPPAPAPPAGPPAASGTVPFREVAAAAGLDFVHHSGATGELIMSEVMGSGAALLDYDADGDLDLFLVQGTGRDSSGRPLGDRLYRNDGPPAAGAPSHFTDVTAESGLEVAAQPDSQGMGVATGDFDNDGRVDLYVTRYGHNRLWRNRGAGADGRVTFEDVTAATGTDDPRWSTAAAFADVDRDGWLDLLVVNYLDYGPHNIRPCYQASSARDYCGPTNFPPQPDRLLHNLGPDEGGHIRFEDISATAGLAAAYGPGLGAVAADVNADGWPDLYVANDAADNQLWINITAGAGRPSFREEALLAGCAVNAAGQREASMGVDAGDADGDGDDDLFLTHLDTETNTLYLNLGDGTFRDASRSSGLGRLSWPYTAFGTAWLDYDGDGWLDLLVANGAVKLFHELAAEGTPPLAEHNQLFRNLGPGTDGAPRFEEATASAGPAFELLEVSRAAAFGDLDNDGDTDVVITQNAGPVRLLLNDQGNTHPWLGLRLLTNQGRDALGAVVTVHLPGGRTLHRHVHSDGSYLAASDPRVLVGLGDAQGVERVEVRWPDGQLETFTGLELGRYATLRAGSGAAAYP